MKEIDLHVLLAVLSFACNPFILMPYAIDCFNLGGLLGCQLIRINNRPVGLLIYIRSELGQIHRIMMNLR